jgi:hypothetical protein
VPATGSRDGRLPVKRAWPPAAQTPASARTAQTGSTTVENTGSLAGDEVVQLYIQEHYAVLLSVGVLPLMS